MHDSANGFGARIAVQRDGRPWTVTSSGAIFRRTSADVTSGSWQQIPGCARDIAADTAVWIIGCTPSGNNHRVEKFNDSFSVPAFVVDPTGGAAKRITVDASGKPWVSCFDGATFRRTSSTLSSGGWELLDSTAVGNVDVAVTPEDYFYRASRNGSWVMAWNEQPALTTSSGATAPARRQWRTFGATGIPIPAPMFLTAIAGMSGGAVLAVDSLGTVWGPAK